MSVTPETMKMVESLARSYTLASKDLTEEERKAIRAKALKALIHAIQSKGKNPADYVYRDVLPKDDLGMADNKWEETLNTAGAWNTIISKTLGDDEFIVFYGVASLSDNPQATAIKFYRGGTPIYLFELEKIYVKQEPEGYFNPIVYAESDTIKVEAYLPSGVTTPATERILLLAIKAEPKERTISPS